MVYLFLLYLFDKISVKLPLLRKQKWENGKCRKWGQAPLFSPASSWTNARV